AVATAAATAVGVQARVVALLLGLTDLAVHLDVIHLNVARAVIVEEVHGDAAAQVGRSSVVLHARAQCPVLDRLVVHAQADLLAAGRAAGADHDRLAAATAAAATAATATATAAAAAAAAAAGAAHGDVGAAAALIPLGRHDRVMVLAEVHADAGPGIEVVAGGDRAAGSLLLTNAPVLPERAVVAGDARRIHALRTIDVVRSAV